MAITLPQDIQDLEIPPGMDARGGDLSTRETFERAQKADFAARDAQDLLQRQIRGVTELTGEQANTASAAHSAKNDAEEKKRRKQSSDALEMQMILNSMRERMAVLDGQIADFEAGFEAKYGDAWREIMANEILDPDEIPERQPGESMEDYRERLENDLIEEMLDENGKIKDEYKNDPEKRQWAQWAEAQHERREIGRDYDVLSDPSSPTEQREASLQNTREYGFNESNQFDQKRLQSNIENSGIEQATEIVADNTDNSLETAAVQGDSMDSFLNAGPNL
ncbi:hypothetical protein [Henriciella sp.]|uniref:hypothetical protein n=1 Tax=Henriciella sp. TaxID=1968823 RepID=UPI00183000C6|nr:hypothetical protein [Henriciella sp.]HIG21764.1 hypothetical protein [Henriciella sp.]